MRNYFFWVIILLFSCKTKSTSFWQNEETKVEKCRRVWQYEDLKENRKLFILLFEKQQQGHLCRFANFIIGITNKQDTIGILDKDFGGILNVGDSITINLDHWEELEKDYIHASFIVYSNMKKNDLLCAVKKVYYGKISTSK